MDKILVLSQPIFEQKPFFEYAQKLLKPGSRVFIVNYANEPTMLLKRFNRIGTPEITEKYMGELREKLRLFSVPEENILYSSDDDTKDAFMEKYLNSDVLIFCGGAPESLLDKLEELNVTELLKDSGKSAIAYSAGGEIFLEHLTLFPSSFWKNAGDYYKKLSTRKAIGLIKDLALSFHYTKDNEAFLQKACNELCSVIYALSDTDGAFVENQKLRWIGTPQKFSPLGD